MENFICNQYAECLANTESIKIFSSSLNSMLIVDKFCSDVCCDEVPVPHIDRKSKRTVIWKILFAISMGDSLF